VTSDLAALLDPFLEQLAIRVADRVRGGLPSSSAGAVLPRLFTVDQAATYLGRTKASVQHMVSAGRLPIVRADRRVFLDVRDLDGWIDQNKKPGII
jgi:excisionase family DNA binding protein